MRLAAGLGGGRIYLQRLLSVSTKAERCFGYLCEQQALLGYCCVFKNVNASRLLVCLRKRKRFSGLYPPLYHPRKNPQPSLKTTGGGYLTTPYASRNRPTVDRLRGRGTAMIAAHLRGTPAFIISAAFPESARDHADSMRPSHRAVRKCPQ